MKAIRPYKNPQVEFITSATSLEDAPLLDGKVELAMIGRSNVGKSSFINGLTRRKRLARTSNTPGKTRLINYYIIDSSWALVDLPGYGYAKVSKLEQRQWAQNIEHYLRNRAGLIGVLQLIDSRHGPQANDQQMNEWLGEAGIEVAVVLTKTDKAKRTQRDKALALTQKLLRFNRGPYLFSALSGEGSESIWWDLKAWREQGLNP